MSVAEAVMEKLSALPPHKQEQVLHYVESLNPPAKTKSEAGHADPYAWLKFAASMNLDGPPDMSEHLDDYLYRNGGDSKH
jgi:hypothetical protein